MAEPTLGEFLGYRADPERGSGTPAVVIDNSQLLNTLNQNARFKAENDWRKYNNFLGEFREFTRDMKEIGDIDIATQDREMLNKKKAELFKDVYDDPKSFFGPGNFAKKAELDKKLSEIRSGSVESKLNRAFDMANREYIARNPELNTKENRNLVDSYMNQPLGKRKSYLLNINPSLDLPTLAKGLNDAVKSTSPYMRSTEGDKFIESGTATRYDPVKFKQLASSMYDLPDKQGRILKVPLQKTFDSLPQEEKQKYEGETDPVKSWYLDTIDKFRLQDTFSKESLKENPFTLLDAKQKAAYALEGLKQGNRESLAMLKHNLSTAPSAQQNETLLNLMGDVMGTTTGETYAVQTATNKYSTEDILNASPRIKQSLSKKGRTAIRQGTSIDDLAETITETETPDILTRTKDGGIRTIFFQKYTKDDIDREKKENKGKSTHSIGEVVRDKNGHPVYESAEKVPQSEVLSILGGGIIDKKQLSNAIGNVTSLLDKNYSGNIINYINERKKGKKNYKVQGKSMNFSDLKKLGYSDEDIQKAVELGNIEEEDEND